MTVLGPAQLSELASIGLALALGLLVGLERGWTQREGKPGTRFAGIRTYGLFGLAGSVAGVLLDHWRTFSAIILATICALIVLSYHRAARAGASISGTGSIVGLLTLACGFLAATGHRMTATAVVVSMVLLLVMRDELHRLVRRMSEAEVEAIARFAAIAVVILPLLPDARLGPLDAWNPRQIWMVVVLVSGFSLAGYLASRLLGARLGTIALAATGSMVSSTAVTAGLAHRIRDEGLDPGIARAAIAVASAVMFVRVNLLTAFLAPFALPTLARLAAPGFAVSLLAAGWFLLRGRKVRTADGAAIPVRNPFALAPALLLAALVMAMSLLARWVLGRFGDRGVATVLAISGSVDVDSAVITMGALPPGVLDAQVAGLVLMAPIVLNTLFKAATTVGIAGWRAGRAAALPLVLSALACAPGLVIALS